VLVSAFLVETNDIPYAVDVNHISELGLVERADVRREGRVETVAWRGERLRFVRLADVVGLPARAAAPGRVPCVIARAGDRLAAVAVDRFVEERETVVKTLGRFGPKLKGVTGALDLEGGRVALLLDMPGLLAREASPW
jgi:two-component system chemotaxis sensor kinase CheA